MAKLEDVLVELKLNAEDFLAGVETAMTTWESFGSSLMKIGAGLSAALTVPIVGVGAAAIKLGTDLQQAEIAFGTMLGSAELAGNYLQELKDFAAKTPFEFKELVPAAKRLMALGFAAEETIPMLTALGNAAAGLGGGAYMIQRLGLALGQMRAKAKVSAEEMRQLAEAGIPAWEMLAKAMGKSTAELMKLSEKGQVSAAAAIPILIQGINEKFGGLMEGFMQTAMGQYSNVKDQLGFVLADIGKALLPIAAMLIEKFALPAVSALRDLAAWFSKLDEGTKLWIISMAGLAAAIGPVTVALGVFGKMYAPLIAGASRVGQVLIPMFGNIASAIQAGTTGQLALAEKQLLSFASVAVPALAAVGIAFAAWQIPAVREKLLELWEVMKQFYSDTIAPFVSDIAKIGTAFVETAAAAVASGLKTLLEDLSALMRSDAAVQFAASLRDLRSAFGDLASAFKPLWDVLEPLIAKLIEWRALMIGAEIWAAVEILKSSIQGLTLSIKSWWELLGEPKLKELTADINVVSEALKGFVFFFKQGIEVMRVGWEVMKQMSPEYALFASVVGPMYDGLKAKADEWLKAMTKSHTGATAVTKSSLDQLTANFKASEEVYAKAVKALSEFDKATGKALGTQEAAAEADVKRQQVKAALVEQMDKEGVGIKTLYDATIKAQSAYNAAVVTMEKLKAAHGQGAEAAKALAAAQANVGQTHQDVVKAQIALTQSGARLGLTLTDIKKQYDTVVTAAKSLEDQEKALKEAVKAATIERDRAIRASKDSIELYDGSEEAIVRLNAAHGEERKALEVAKAAYERMIVSVDRLQKAEDELNPEKTAERRAKANEAYAKHLEELEKKGLEAIKARVRFNEEIVKLDAELEHVAERTALNLGKAYEAIRKEATQQIEITPPTTTTPYGEISPEQALEYARRMGSQYPVMLFGPLQTWVKDTASILERELGPALGRTIDQTTEFIRAHRAISIETTKDLQNQVEAERIALEQTKRLHAEGKASAYDVLQRQKAYYEAQLAAARASGSGQVAELEKMVEAIDKQLAKLSGKYKGFWRQLTDEVKQIVSGMGRDFGAGLFGILIGSDRREYNKQLDEQTGELQASLAERTAEWEAYQVEVAQQWEQAQAEYAASLAKDVAELRASLAEREAEYAQSEIDTAASLETVRQEYAAKLAADLRELQDNLSERETEYNDYVAEITTQMEEVRRSHAEQLAGQLQDLQDTLADKRQAYEEYVADVQKTLSRTYEDYNENLDDQTKSVKGNIADKQRAYDRDEEDILTRIERLKKAGKTEQGEEVQDLRKSLTRKQEDLKLYIDEQNANLEEFTSDAKRRLDREVSDLQESLSKRTAEWAAYQKENQAKRDEYITKNRQDLDKELGDLQASLTKRTNEFEAYKAGVAAKAEEIRAASAEGLAKEEADLIASLDKKKGELDKYRAEVAVKLDGLVADYNARLATEHQALITSLDNRRAEYDKFVTDINKRLDDLKEKHRGILDDIGGMFENVFTRAGEALSGFVGQFLVGMLMKELKTLLEVLLPSVSQKIKDVFDATKVGTGNVPTGLPGGVPGLPSPGGGGVPPIPGAGAAGAASGLMGTLGSIGSMVGAVSGVIGNFQMAGMNKTLDEMGRTMIKVEHYTLFALTTQLEYLPALKDIWWYLWNAQEPLLRSMDELMYALDAKLLWIFNVLDTKIWPALDAVTTAMRMGAVAGGGGASGTEDAIADAGDTVADAVTDSVEDAVAKIMGGPGSPWPREAAAGGATPATATVPTGDTRYMTRAEMNARTAKPLYAKGDLQRLLDSYQTSLKNALSGYNPNDPNGQQRLNILLTQLSDLKAAGKTESDQEVQDLLDKIEADAQYAYLKNVGPAYQAWYRDMITQTQALLSQWDKYTAENTRSSRSLLGDTVSRLDNLVNAVGPRMIPTVMPSMPLTAPATATETVPVVVKELTVKTVIDGREVGNALIENLTVQGVRI